MVHLSYNLVILQLEIFHDILQSNLLRPPVNKFVPSAREGRCISKYWRFNHLYTMDALTNIGPSDKNASQEKL